MIRTASLLTRPGARGSAALAEPLAPWTVDQTGSPCCVARGSSVDARLTSMMESNRMGAGAVANRPMNR
jgi:hypothetical protein